MSNYILFLEIGNIVFCHFYKAMSSQMVSEEGKSPFYVFWCLWFQSFSCARLCLQGSMCNDFLTDYFFCCCATCQLKRDINRRKEQNIFWVIHFFFKNIWVLVPEQKWHYLCLKVTWNVLLLLVLVLLWKKTQNIKLKLGGKETAKVFFFRLWNYLNVTPQMHQQCLLHTTWNLTG